MSRLKKGIRRSLGVFPSVANENGALNFGELIKPSKNSTFRIVPSVLSMGEKMRADIVALGGKSEYNQYVGIIAVEIPASTPIQPFLDYIVEEQIKGVLDFEESALRHEMDHS
ncbi:DUF4265 domain-containing protein [Pinirhizobacter sp.]|jgi:hypothetical protein|uniref:DUF4265 domain-containing protein n=1 Tax=Pinirhizobacter sp. TaxID=2950432 RepID=UPI0039C951F9